MRNGKNGTARRIAAGLACLTLSAIGLTQKSTAAPVSVLTAGSDTVQVGDVFVIPISVMNVAGLTSFQFDLAFNPAIIKALSFTDIGTDFDTAATAGGGSLTGITGFIDNTTGLLSGVADSISGLITGNGLTPGGILVDIDFQALAGGISPLILSNAFLTDSGVPLSSANGDFLLQNGQVTAIGPAAVPEPGRLLLLSLAFAFGFWVHRRQTMKPVLFVFAAVAVAALGTGPVGAQTFQNGPYYATPSWDQQIPAAQRFVVLSNWNNDAVLDRETGLVWQRAPLMVDVGFVNALDICWQNQIGGRKGWRLPAPEELMSLIDPTTEAPALPAGHPFQQVPPEAQYWTASTFSSSPSSSIPSFIAVVRIDQGIIQSTTPEAGNKVWCVRGGSHLLTIAPGY